jgi:hypothetical protein
MENIIISFQRFYYMNNKIMALPSIITNANQKDQQFITPIKVYQFE